MREYSKVSPQFWVWARQNGLDRDEMLVALYLMTCPASDMFGIFYLVVPEMAHYLGSPLEGASKALRRVVKKGFAEVDEGGSGMVWVRNMAGWQVLTDFEPLKDDDNRIKGANKWYERLPENPFLYRFFEKYHDLLHLNKCRGEAPYKPLTSPSEGAPGSDADPLANQEQEQEQAHEQEHEQEKVAPSASRSEPPATSPVITIPLNDGSEHPVTEENVAEWKGAYPAVDVMQALRSARQWCIANPTRKKTKRGVVAFLTRWLDTEQNKGRAAAAPVRSPAAVGYHPNSKNFEEGDQLL